MTNIRRRVTPFAARCKGKGDHSVAIFLSIFFLFSFCFAKLLRLATRGYERSPLIARADRSRTFFATPRTTGESFFAIKPHERPRAFETPLPQICQASKMDRLVRDTLFSSTVVSGSVSIFLFLFLSLPLCLQLIIPRVRARQSASHLFTFRATFAKTIVHRYVFEDYVQRYLLAKTKQATCSFFIKQTHFPQKEKLRGICVLRCRSRDNAENYFVNMSHVSFLLQILIRFFFLFFSHRNFTVFYQIQHKFRLEF